MLLFWHQNIHNIVNANNGPIPLPPQQQHQHSAIF